MTGARRLLASAAFCSMIGAGAAVAPALAGDRGGGQLVGDSPDRQAPGRVLARAAAPLGQLEGTRAVSVPGGGRIERYRQRVGDLPVLGGEAVIARPEGGAAVLVSDHTEPGLEPAKQARLSREGAIRRARLAAGARGLRARPLARLALDPGHGRAVWWVVLASSAPLGDFSVLVDARSGKVERVRDLLRRASATANLYLPNPVTTQGGFRGLRDAEDRNSALLTALRRPVTLERIDNGRGCLSGTHVEVRVGRGKRARSVCSDGFDFSGVTRAANAFEAVMAYFHVDRTRAYIDSLGLSRPLRPKPQRIEVNSFPDDNSYFSPASGKMAFGTGGVDDGEDADVIVHEYGHSVQDRAVHLFGETLDGASIGEGFGDYLAAAMSALETGGTSSFDACMFEWDATSYTRRGCARRADRSISKQRALKRCFGDPHCIGEAWSGALWKLRGELGVDSDGRSVADRVVLESHFMLTRRTKFRDAARTLIAADGLLYGGAHAAVIEAEMLARGFCKRSC